MPLLSLCTGGKKVNIPLSEEITFYPSKEENVYFVNKHCLFLVDCFYFMAPAVQMFGIEWTDSEYLVFWRDHSNFFVNEFPITRDTFYLIYDSKKISTEYLNSDDDIYILDFLTLNPKPYFIAGKNYNYLKEYT